MSPSKSNPKSKVSSKAKPKPKPKSKAKVKAKGASKSPAEAEVFVARDPHVLLRVISKFLIPLIALFAFYVQFHGDYGPGGGFQAGVILAASVILYALVYGLAEAKKAFPPRLIRYGMTLGVLLYGGTGVVSFLMGGEFLNYSVLAENAAAGQHYGILAIELGVLVTVTTVMIAIFYAFGSRQPETSDEDW